MSDLRITEKKDARPVVDKIGPVMTIKRHRHGLSRLLLAISITLLAFVTLLQPSTANFDILLIDPLEKKTALILTAHPDDEVMFFTPTILALREAGWVVDALCLSNGNGDGLGEIREKELFKSYERLGVSPERVVVLDDPRLQDGMNNHWSSSYVSQVLDKHLESHPPSIIITFDLIGITHHPNHIALAHGCSFGPRRSPGQCYALQSPSVLAKFTGPLWAVWYNIFTHYRTSKTTLSLRGGGEKLKKSLTIVNTPQGWLQGARAMWEHGSQLVWFRYLYFAASRLVWINQLEELLEHG